MLYSEYAGTSVNPPVRMCSSSSCSLFSDRALSRRGSRFLGRQGYVVSPQAQSHRNAGIVFHQERAAAAERGSNPWPIRVAVILAIIGLAILLELWTSAR